MPTEPPASANLSRKEKDDLAVLAFIRKQSARDAAGDAIRAFLKRHKNAIAATNRMRKLLPDK